MGKLADELTGIQRQLEQLEPKLALALSGLVQDVAGLEQQMHFATLGLTEADVGNLPSDAGAVIERLTAGLDTAERGLLLHMFLAVRTETAQQLRTARADRQAALNEAAMLRGELAVYQIRHEAEGDETCSICGCVWSPKDRLACPQCAANREAAIVLLLTTDGKRIVPGHTRLWGYCEVDDDDNCVLIEGVLLIKRWPVEVDDLQVTAVTGLYFAEDFPWNDTAWHGSEKAAKEAEETKHGRRAGGCDAPDDQTHGVTSLEGA